VVVSPLAAGIDQMDVQFQYVPDSGPRSAAGPVRPQPQPASPAAQPELPGPPKLQRS